MVSTHISQLHAGIDPIDEAWGGLYRGGSYLVYGPQGSGRSLLALAFTHRGCDDGEPALFISPRRPRDLRIQATTLDFDLRAAYDSGIVRLMRIPPMLTLHDAGDDGIARALDDLAAILHAYQPARVVIDDFVPFVQFASFDRFCTTFLNLLDKLDPLDTTLLLVMAEPANTASRQVVAFMRQHVTGTIHTTAHLQNGDRPTFQLHLTASLGHPLQPIVTTWSPFDPEEPAAPDAIPAAAELSGAASTPDDIDDAAEPVPEHPAAEVVQESAPLIRAVPLGTTAAAPPAAPSPSIQPIPLGHRSAAEPAPTTVAAAAATRLEAFRTRLQPYFQQRNGHTAPFLLIALHLTLEGETYLPFPTLLSLTRALLRPADAFYADPPSRRLVVLLTDSAPGAEQRFFEQLRERLVATTPQHADALIHEALITAAVPNGKPFERADEFLAWALYDR